MFTLAKIAARPHNSAMNIAASLPGLALAFALAFALSGLFPLATARAAPMPPDMSVLAARLLPCVVSIASTDPASEAVPDGSGGGQGNGSDNGSDNGSGGGARARGGLRPTPVSDLSDAATTVIPPPKAEEALGSGFIVDPAGYIVTNNHVIDGAASVSVTFSDGTILPATIVGQDKRGDIAVLKVSAGHRLPAVRFGDSSELRVGDWVLAIGNPYGLDESASSGIVSALHRDIGEGRYDDFIQTDAAINRGNSGGPLFDLTGHVIGINSAIYSPSGGSVGIGFAIPSAMVQPVVQSLETTGTIKRGWLGISSQNVTPEIAKLLGLPDTSGALVGGVMRDGPAAGILQPGDVLVSLNGVRISDTRSLTIRTAQVLSGQVAEAQFWRAGRLRQAAITIAVPPPDLPPGKSPPPPVRPNINIAALGIAISPASSAGGLTVIAVTPGGPAADAGLVADNIIAAIGAVRLASAEALRERLEALKRGNARVAVLLVEGDTATGSDPGPRWVAVPLGQ